MMSKSTPPIVFDVDEPGDDIPDHGTAPARSSTRRLLSRIAKALQVPEAVLYDLPNARASTRAAAPDRLDVVELEIECTALLEAYRRIDDPGMRHRILRIAETAADQP
jgi:hypothetical protein